MTTLQAELTQESGPKKPSSPQTVRYRLDPGTLSQVAEAQVDLLCQLLYDITPLALETWESSRKAWLNAKDPVMKEAHGLILRAQIETLARTFGSIFNAFEKQMTKAMDVADKDDEGSLPGTVENGTDTKPNGIRRGWRETPGRGASMDINKAETDETSAPGTVENTTDTRPDSIGQGWRDRPGRRR